MNVAIRSIAVLATLCLASQGFAFECVNNGAQPDASPNDGGVATAFACGPTTLANAVDSTALGSGAVAIGTNTTAIGAYAAATQANSVILGSVPGLNLATNYADVGIGTNAPLAPLHLSRNDGSAMILVEEASATAAPRTLFMLANAGNTKFEVMNTEAANSWAFTNSGRNFRISLQDSGVVEFYINNNGDAYLAGVLNQNSDRNAKTDIVPVNTGAILEKVASLPITEWSYKDALNSRHIGPMAQDFHAAFGTGSSDTSLATIDVGGVAIASIQALNDKLEAQNEDLRAQNADLADRVAILEAMVSELLPKVSQN